MRNAGDILPPVGSDKEAVGANQSPFDFEKQQRSDSPQRQSRTLPPRGKKTIPPPDLAGQDREDDQNVLPQGRDTPQLPPRALPPRDKRTAPPLDERNKEGETVNPNRSNPEPQRRDLEVSNISDLNTGVNQSITPIPVPASGGEMEDGMDPPPPPIRFRSLGGDVKTPPTSGEALSSHKALQHGSVPSVGDDRSLVSSPFQARHAFREENRTKIERSFHSDTKSDASSIFRSRENSESGNGKVKPYLIAPVGSSSESEDDRYS